jgi:nucleoside-diphosphate-sugar epimerase
MIYGARDDRNMARLLELVRRLPFIPVPGGGNHLQQPVHVDDLAAAIVAAAGTDDAIGKAYNVAGPAPVALREIIEQACAAAGRPARLVSVPLAPAVIVAGLYERIVAHPRFRAEQFQRLAENKAYDIEPARRDLGFDPRPFQAGIEAQARARDTAPARTV